MGKFAYASPDHEIATRLHGDNLYKIVCCNFHSSKALSHLVHLTLKNFTQIPKGILFHLYYLPKGA